MATFYCLWQQERIREQLFARLARDDVCNVRLASSACCNVVTRRLFRRMHVTFTAHTFTRPSRMQALSRIGHHVEHLTFFLAHSDATFLPPLVRASGEEVAFLYTPPTCVASVPGRPRYGNAELGELLTQQYPPLFHAASNVASFLEAMGHLRNMRHLSIKTPGDGGRRQRRDVVDYALVSLRIAVERARLERLSKLTLAVHAGAFVYLRATPGIGSSPAAARRWRQIRKLHVTVHLSDGPSLDHVKIMHDFVRSFAPDMESFSLTWLGRRGPFPMALHGESPRQRLFHEVTSPMSPLPPRPSPSPVTMPRLRFLTVRNATADARQLRELLARHKHSLRDVELDKVELEGGSWDDALAPLDEMWSRDVVPLTSSHDVAPLTWSRDGGEPVTSGPADDCLQSSPAADAAARELQVDAWASGTVADSPCTASCSPETPRTRTGPEAGLTRLKKRRKKSRRHHRSDDSATEDDDRERSHGRCEVGEGRRSRRRRRKEAETPDKPETPTRIRSNTTPPSRPSATPARRTRPSPVPARDISAPIQDTDSFPVLQPTTYSPLASASDGLSAAQRAVEAELAEEARMRASALRRARDAVITKLTREFCRRGRGAAATDSAAVAASLLSLSRSDVHLAAAGTVGLFGRGAAEVVVPDCRTLESQTALVPLMFSRS